MICKKCGKAIDPNQQSCPHCGYLNESSEKGNGFWDMAAPHPKTQPVVQTKPSVDQKDVPKSTSNRAIPLIIALGTLALGSIVLSVVLFAISNSKIEQNRADYTRDMNATREEFNQSITSAKQSSDEQVNALGETIGKEMTGLSESVDSLRSDLDEVKDTVPSVLRIVTSPIDQVVPEGFTSDGETYLFTVEINGSVASFKWEKQAANGSWIELVFDSEGHSASLGLSKQEDATKGYSRLIATGLTAEAAGIYKCIIASTDGIEKELNVTLTIEEAEPTPTPASESAEPSNAPEPTPEGTAKDSDTASPTPTQTPRRRG